METISLNVLNDFVAFIAGLILNAYLIYLIHKHTPELMRSYSRMLRIHCLSDCLYGLINFLAAVHPTPLKGTVFLILSGIYSHASIEFTSYLLRAYVWSVLFPIALIPIDFYYRYRSVCYGKPPSNNELFGMVFLAYFLTFVEAFFHSNLFIIYGPGEKTRKYELILHQYSTTWKGPDTPSFSVYESTDPFAISCLVIIMLLICFVYAVVIYTIRHINAKVRSECMMASNKNLISTHKQVARILFIQAAIPLVLCIPSTITCAAGLLHMDLPTFGVYALSTSVWLPVLKPLAAIIVIPSYRRAFLCTSKRIGNSTVSNITA